MNNDEFLLSEIKSILDDFDPSFDKPGNALTLADQVLAVCNSVMVLRQQRVALVQAARVFNKWHVKCGLNRDPECTACRALVAVEEEGIEL